jgi:hypothetical protein
MQKETATSIHAIHRPILALIDLEFTVLKIESI